MSILQPPSTWITFTDYRTSMALRELTLLSFFLVASSLFAETAADYVNRGAQKYIFGQDQAAASEVATGLRKFPNDPELQGIAATTTARPRSAAAKRSAVTGEIRKPKR